MQKEIIAQYFIPQVGMYLLLMLLTIIFSLTRVAFYLVSKNERICADNRNIFLEMTEGLTDSIR